MTSKIELRPAKADDYQFALDLYLEGMELYTSALMEWDEQRQTASFSRNWTLEDVRIVQENGVHVGWLQSAHLTTEIRLYQLFVEVSQRDRGIGSSVLSLLQADWNRAGKPVLLTVLKNNPARRLYERFGFHVTGEVGVKLEMKRMP